MAQTVSNWIDRWNFWSISTQDLAKVILDVAKRKFRETATAAKNGHGMIYKSEFVRRIRGWFKF